jgi:hypothetical protein
MKRLLKSRAVGRLAVLVWLALLIAVNLDCWGLYDLGMGPR